MPTTTEAPTTTQRRTTATTQASDSVNWADDDAEYQLASLDAGERLDLDDPAILLYAEALNDAEAVCDADSRTLIGDMAVVSSQILADDGIDSSILELLTAVASIGGSPWVAVRGAFAAVVTLVQAEN